MVPMVPHGQFMGVLGDLLSRSSRGSGRLRLLGDAKKAVRSVEMATKAAASHSPGIRLCGFQGGFAVYMVLAWV